MANRTAGSTLIKAVRLARGCRRGGRIVAIPLILLGLGLPLAHLIMGIDPPLPLIGAVFALAALIVAGQRLREWALRRIEECSDPRQLCPLLAARDEATSADPEVDWAIERGIEQLAFQLGLDDWTRLDGVELDQLKSILSTRRVEGLQAALAQDQVLPPWLRCRARRSSTPWGSWCWFFWRLWDFSGSISGYCHWHSPP